MALRLMLSSQRGLPGLGVSGYQIEQPMRGARLDAAEEAKFQSGRELQTSITGLEDATTITTADGSGKAGYLMSGNRRLTLKEMAKLMGSENKFGKRPLRAMNGARP